MNNILYFPNKNKIEKVSKELTKKISFTYSFKHKKNIYLENDRYLVVISKHFIRVLIFNSDNIKKDIVRIKKEISDVNITKS